MASNNNNNKISTGVRSRSPDPYHSPYKKNHSRRHTLPAKFHYSHPYFSQHTHHVCNSLSDDSIDTSSLNQGILFYQDPSNGETNFYWEDELETCSPSLMPENTDRLMIDDISGDSTDLEEKYFRIMANELNKQKEQKEQKDENMNDNNQLGESKVDSPNETILNQTEDFMNLDDPDVTLPPEDFIIPSEKNEFNLEDMVNEMNELLSDKNQELEEEDPPSPLSPRDPEREGPVLSEEEENTEEGVLYRFEHDPKFQDEAGLDDNEDAQISDDEGTDPMENH